MNDLPDDQISNRSAANTLDRRLFLQAAAGAGIASVVGIGSVSLAAAQEETNAGEELWRQKLGYNTTLSPVVDGTLFVSAGFSGNDDYVYAFDASTGEQQWRLGFSDHQLLWPPNVVDGTAFVATTDDYVYALDADTGEIAWHFESPGEVIGLPTVVDDLVFTPTYYCVYALDANTGERAWQYKVGYGVSSEPAVVDGTLFVGDFEGNVFAVDVATGEEVWRFVTDNTLTNYTSPTIVDDTVFVGVEDSVHVLDAATGEERRRLETGKEIQSLNVMDGTLFVSTATSSSHSRDSSLPSSLYALDPATGEDTWHVEVDASVNSSMVVDGTLFVTGDDAGDHDGIVIALDATTGERVWRVGLKADAKSFLMEVDGTLLVGDHDGNVYALDAVTGDEEWRFNAGDSVSGPPTVVDDTLFVRGKIVNEYKVREYSDREPIRIPVDSVSRLYALDAVTGAERWRFENEEGGISSLRTADGTLFFWAPDFLYAFDAGVPDSSEDAGTGNSEGSSADDDDDSSESSTGDDDGSADDSPVDDDDDTDSGSDTDSDDAADGDDSEESTDGGSSDDDSEESSANADDEEDPDDSQADGDHDGTENASNDGDDESPGMGIPAAVTGLGGVGYLLSRRLERLETDDDS